MSAAPLISIIDDDESLRLALVGLARSVGYDARGFACAEAFLQFGAIETFSCLVTDIQMPGMSGIDLKHHLVAQQITLPVIMITARPDADLEARARAAGAIGFLRKPFEASVLIGFLDAAMGR